jgi:tRNA_anti-like
LQSVQFMSIPFPLKLIAGVVIVLIILLIFLIKKKKKNLVFLVLILTIITIGFGLWKGLEEYNRTNKDLVTVDPDIKISSGDLIHQYEANDSIADQKYLGKVIEVNGNIAKVERDEKGYYTVVFGDGNRASTVRCSMDTVHNQDAANLKEGSSAIIRGACTGFNKDEMGLGSDVILNRCAVIDKKDL